MKFHSKKLRTPSKRFVSLKLLFNQNNLVVYVVIIVFASIWLLCIVLHHQI
jgi:hypothetical protein